MSPSQEDRIDTHLHAFIRPEQLVMLHEFADQGSTLQCVDAILPILLCGADTWSMT